MDITTRNIEQCDAPSVLAAVLDAHDHPQKIDQIAAAISPIAAAAAAYSEGKPQLAQAITAKGVTTAADASLATMAQNVSAIIQQQTIISGGDAYKQQLFSDANPAKAVLWDLYQVLAQMKTLYLSGESAYTGLLVCEYDKSLDAVDLDKANAWVCSDMVDKTTPILSTDDTHHVWNDANDGKANRWICFLYTNSAGGTFTITSSDAALSPLSIYVGGHINTIEYQTNGKLTELVSGLTENDYVDEFIIKTYTQKWNRDFILRNIKSSSRIEFTGGTKNVFIGYKNFSAALRTTNIPEYLIYAGSDVQFIKLNGLLSTTGGDYTREVIYVQNNVIDRIEIPDLQSTQSCVIALNGSTTKSLRCIKTPNYTSLSGGYSRYIQVGNGATTENLIDIEVGAMTTNFYNLNWNPTNVLADATKKAQLVDNIKNHILARVSKPSSGTLSFTVSQNMWTAIKDEVIDVSDIEGIEGTTMTLYDAFAAKNWNFTYA